MRDVDSLIAGKSKFLCCQLCGREFGSASLPIHMKQCQQKQAVQAAQRKAAPIKQFKARKVPRSVMGEHAVTSPTVVESEESLNENPKKESKSNSKAEKSTRSPVRGNEIASTLPKKDIPLLNENYQQVLKGQLTIDEFNRMSLDEYQRTAVEREVCQQCEHCGRKFIRPEGFRKHQQLCERQGSNGGVFALPSQKQSASASTRLEKESRPTKPPINFRDMEGQQLIHKQIEPKIVPSEGVSTKNLGNPSSIKADGKQFAQYCAACGVNFNQLTQQNNQEWKFCPQCGSKRLTL